MLKIEDIHQKIYNDPEWRMWNDMIDALTTEHGDKFSTRHGSSHLFDVANTAMAFASEAGATEHEIMLTDIAALLHDCGLICGDEKHAKIGAKIAYAFLHARWGKLGGTIKPNPDDPPAAIRTNGPLSDEDIDIICHAISVHSDGIGIENIVDAAVCLADKLDIGKHRVISVGDNEIQKLQSKIDHLEYQLTDDALIINYVTDPDFENFDIKALIRRWPKSIMIPDRIADFMGKIAHLQLNGKNVT